MVWRRDLLRHSLVPGPPARLWPHFGPGMSKECPGKPQAVRIAHRGQNLTSTSDYALEALIPKGERYPALASA
jgi:hypothetical protein